MNNKKTLGVVLLLYGLFSLFNVNELFGVSHAAILGFFCLGYSLILVYISLGNNQRALLLLANFIFFAGLLLIVTSFFHIIEKDHLFLTAFLFVLGNGCLLLFIDNVSQKHFLVTSLILFGLSYSAKYVVGYLGDFSLIANIGLIMLGYWPVFLVFFGIALLVNRKP